ncbi:hypothetical protein B7494_g4522 [Chlorociboria aeruginascens]|nr:hypothetical protein B7494_g4522 [Chlorociboria aeruginascens]
MLLARSPPPSFLIPAWSAPQLYYALRAYSSNNNSRRRDAKRRQHAQPLYHETAREEGTRAKSGRAGASKISNGPSLFDELFPEEKKIQPAQKSLNIDKLPAFDFVDPKSWVGKEKDGVPMTLSRSLQSISDQGLNRYRENRYREDQLVRREASVLVLNGASKNLEESDFFRLSPKGEHIEGWTSGILKVIPGRDYQTLESSDYYFILFSSDAAAQAYLDQIHKLHTAAKVRAKGAVPIPLPVHNFNKDNIDGILNGFSLVPAHEKVSMRMVYRPYRPGLSKILTEGGAPAITIRQNRGEETVLLSVEKGLISEFDLKEAIDLDSRKRNLLWKVVEHEGIVKFDEFKGFKDRRPSDIEESLDERFKAPTMSRFIISFKDRDEARRFVRDWHRRPLPMKWTRNSGDESPPMVNARFIW